MSATVPPAPTARDAALRENPVPAHVAALATGQATVYVTGAMATRFRDRYFTSLEPAAAEALGAALEELLESPRQSGGVDYGDSHAPELGDDGALLTVTTAGELRGDEEEGILDGDIAIVVESTSTVSSVEDLRKRGVVADAAAIERLTSCRSTITLEYVSYAAKLPVFVSVQRILLDRIGPALVEPQGGAHLVSSESFARELRSLRGSSRLEPLRRSPVRARKKRDARLGELESIALRGRLAEAIADPFASGKLRRALEEATMLERSYASLLLDDGPQSDARAAKSLGVTASAIAETRAALCAVLDR
jgi:hypothetical protein